jgi:predicted nucleotidyltransferase
MDPLTIHIPESVLLAVGSGRGGCGDPGPAAPRARNGIDFGGVFTSLHAMAETDELRKLFGALPDVAVAVLFGSAARGALTSDSDVDLAVALSSGPVDSQMKQRLLETVGERLGRPADIVDLRNQRGRLAARIMREGVPLVIRDTALWGRLLRDAVMWQEEMAPLWRVVQRGKLDRLVHGS